MDTPFMVTVLRKAERKVHPPSTSARAAAFGKTSFLIKRKATGKSKALPLPPSPRIASALCDNSRCYWCLQVLGKHATNGEIDAIKDANFRDFLQVRNLNWKR